MEINKKFGVIWDQTGFLYAQDNGDQGRGNVRKTFKKVFANHGVKITDEIFSEKYRGTSLANQMSMWKRDFQLNIPISVQQFSKEAAKIEYGIIDPKKAKDENTMRLLRELKSYNVPMVIATSSTRERALNITKLLGQDEYIQEIISCEDVENHEPSIDTLTLAAKKMGLYLEDCIVIEDAASGIIAAKKAGCKTIGYTVYSEEQYKSLSNSNPDLLVRSFRNMTYKTLRDLFVHK